MGEDEIKKMVRESELHAEEDRNAQEKSEAHNVLDSLIYQTEKTLQQHGGKVSDDIRRSIETELQNAREALNSENVARMKSATESLQQSTHKLAEAIFAASGGQQAQSGSNGQTPPPPPPGGGAGAGMPGDNISDAEFTDN